MPNGDRRYVKTTKPGSLKAKVKIGGKTVSGLLTFHPDKGGDYSFAPNPSGVNALSLNYKIGAQRAYQITT